MRINLWISTRINVRFINFTRGNGVIAFDYNVDGCILQRVNSIKILGVYFTPSFKFNTHVDIIVWEAHRISGYLFRICNFNNETVLKSLIYSLVKSKFYYCSVVLKIQSACLIDSMEKCQKDL